MVVPGVPDIVWMDKHAGLYLRYTRPEPWHSMLEMYAPSAYVARNLRNKLDSLGWKNTWPWILVCISILYFLLFCCCSQWSWFRNSLLIYIL